MLLDFLFQGWRRWNGYFQWWSLWLFSSRFMSCVSGVVFDDSHRTLLQRIKLELAPDQSVALAPEATLRPKHGLRMNIQPIAAR